MACAERLDERGRYLLLLSTGAPIVGNRAAHYYFNFFAEQNFHEYSYCETVRYEVDQDPQAVVQLTWLLPGFSTTPPSC